MKEILMSAFGDDSALFDRLFWHVYLWKVHPMRTMLGELHPFMQHVFFFFFFFFFFC